MREEKIIVGEGGKYPLKGILTLPDDTAHPVPAVVFVHGSGSSNMDEKVGKLTPFKDLAHGLAERGIASIRYNKRSFSHGLKMLLDKSAPITAKEETIDDAILATELLKKDGRIAPDKIFIVGHSMGGMLAPRIDAEGGNYRGLILMAGTPRKLEEVMRGQVEEMQKTATGLMKKIADKQAQQILPMFDGLYELGDEEAKKKKVGGGTTLYYFKEMGEHDARSYLAATQKPMLILQGEKDVQVKMDRDFGLYREILGERENVTFRLYAGLNHAFVPALYDDIIKATKEFSKERHIGDEVIGDMARWILSN
ncbi:MAG: alpha/beta fold hydrolase [Oscillospiraceae bacterium]|nr:alpha/beta fold hydrolase [Oscillospiraceae bacterium]